MKALLDALNVIYEEEEKRNFIVLNATSLLFTIGAILLLMVALACVLVVPIVLGYLPDSLVIFEPRQMAGTAGRSSGAPHIDLPLRPEAHDATLAMDHMG